MRWPYALLTIVVAAAVAFAIGYNVQTTFFVREPSRSAPCPGPLTLNEGLATTLRGVQVGDAAARAIGIPAGYYRIREFRTWDVPPGREDQLYGVVIEIARPYAECYLGQSSLPNICDEWVFTRPSILEPVVSGVHRTLYDYRGHVFSYRYIFDPARRCGNVVTAKLDGQPVTLFLQDLSERLLTCDVSSEPPFTRPAHPCQ